MEIFTSTLAAFFILMSTISQMKSFPLKNTLAYEELNIYEWQHCTKAYSDNSCPNDSIERKYNESRNSCLSLEELLQKHSESYFTFYTMELFLSGILNGLGNREGITCNSVRFKEKLDSSCPSLLKVTRDLITKDGVCEWKYVCKFNPHYFPSFTVTAQLIEETDADYCEKKTISNTKLVKVPRLNDLQQECWFPCRASRIVTGFKELE